MQISKIIFFLTVSLLLQSCAGVSYYWEKIQGHAEILNKQRPIQDAIDDPLTTAETRKRLQSAKQARRFASEVLKLPDNGSYKEYADIERKYVVWTVVATAEFSIQPQEWCFLIVGCLSYRGYFSEQSAEEFAVELKNKNMDVYVAGIKAYSTLGWFDDPLISTMLYKTESSRIGIIFHELAHQQMYVENDTAFNEAFASTVELEGIKHWYNINKNKQGFKQYVLAKQRDQQFKALLQRARKNLAVLYKKYPENFKKENKKDLTPTEKSLLIKEKAWVFKSLKMQYAELKKQWKGYSGYDLWMSKKLNNAHLASVATYNNWIPAFSELLKQSNNDFELFYKQVKVLSELSKKDRTLKLEALMPKRESAS